MVPMKLKDTLGIEDLELFGYPMCTGILAYDEDGSVLHARNLDFMMAEYLHKL